MNTSEILIFKSLDILQTVQKYRIFIRRQDFACTDISYLVKLLPIKSLRDYDQELISSNCFSHLRKGIIYN